MEVITLFWLDWSCENRRNIRLGEFKINQQISSTKLGNLKIFKNIIITVGKLFD